MSDSRIIINGLVTEEALEANKKYAETHVVTKCERCGKDTGKPISMCVCGLYIGDCCISDHYSGM